jgi:hypothetical protein
MQRVIVCGSGCDILLYLISGKSLIICLNMTKWDLICRTP